MIDITDQLVVARERGEWPADAVRSLADDAAELRSEWEPGDDWVRLLHAQTVIALAWIHGPVVVTTRGHIDLVDEIVMVTGMRPEVIVVPNMHTPVLRLDPNRLREIWPDRGFPIEAVDAEGGMSAIDLWYATA